MDGWLNKRALLKAGWTPALIAGILGPPDQVVEHKHGYKKWTEHLYGAEKVEAGAGDARFLEAAARRRRRTAAAEHRCAAIPEQYRGDWRAALGDAAAGMFQLNRYAKHRRCSEVRRVEIYLLKNEFIRMLYARGYCSLAWIHRLELPEQTCRECGGDGVECDHCGGAGVWREARTVEFWCFRFAIGGRAYCWHQPRNLVEFTPVAGLPPQEWEWRAEEKPVVLPERRIAYVKELVGWVIGAAEEER
jgi:hypothetical protein